MYCCWSFFVYVYISIYIYICVYVFSINYMRL